jgi:hypothetical protein
MAALVKTPFSVGHTLSPLCTVIASLVVITFGKENPAPF